MKRSNDRTHTYIEEVEERGKEEVIGKELKRFVQIEKSSGVRNEFV